MQSTFFQDFTDGPTGELIVKRVNSQTARIPCQQWHYLGSMPSASTDCFGVWERGTFQGVLIFGSPVARQASSMFGIAPNQIRELLRIALNGHTSPITQMLKLAIRQLKRETPNVEVLISYADSGAGHLGYVYQAASWVYLGPRDGEPKYVIRGRAMHLRNVNVIYGSRNVDWLRKDIDPDLEIIPQPIKHKYALGLNRKMRRYIESLSQPYPKG